MRNLFIYLSYFNYLICLPHYFSILGEKRRKKRKKPWSCRFLSSGLIRRSLRVSPTLLLVTRATGLLEGHPGRPVPGGQLFRLVADEALLPPQRHDHPDGVADVRRGPLDRDGAQLASLAFVCFDCHRHAGQLDPADAEVLHGPAGGTGWGSKDFSNGSGFSDFHCLSLFFSFFLSF